ILQMERGLVRISRRLRHQLYVKIVKLVRVHIELYCGWSLVGRKERAWLPEQRFTVTWSMVDVDIHVELFLTSDNCGINQSRSGKLIPHKAGHGVLRQVASNRSIGLGDSGFDLR